MVKIITKVILFVYGLFFALNFEDIFLEYIAPIIVKDTKNITISSLVGIISILVIFLTIADLISIINDIKRTCNIQSKRKFKEYLIKLSVVSVLSILSAIVVRKIFLN